MPATDPLSAYDNDHFMDELRDEELFDTSTIDVDDINLASPHHPADFESKGGNMRKRDDENDKHVDELTEYAPDVPSIDSEKKEEPPTTLRHPRVRPGRYYGLG